MTVENAEIGLWLALTCWVIGFLVCLYALVFQKERLLAAAAIIAAVGLLPHTAGIAIRWAATGRPPFINLYELVSASAWFAVATYLVVQAIWRNARPVAVAVLPVAFLSMGATLTLSPEPNALTASLESWWLVIHVLFALIAHGGFAIAFGAAILLVLKSRGQQTQDQSLVPAADRLDLLCARSIIFGFVCHTVMILSGSIWANNAWGSFWRWDPVETWSLIAWLLYGLYAHLRILKSWRGRRSAIYSIVAFLVVVFSYWGVSHIWATVHDYTLFEKGPPSTTRSAPEGPAQEQAGQAEGADE